MHPILARTLVHKRREIDDREIRNRHTLGIAREGAVVEIRVCAALIGLNNVDHRDFSLLSLLAANADHWPKQYLFPPGLCVQPAQIRPTILIVMRAPPLGVKETMGVCCAHFKRHSYEGGHRQSKPALATLAAGHSVCLDPFACESEWESHHA
jgi:hypothetical protein